MFSFAKVGILEQFDELNPAGNVQFSVDVVYMIAYGMGGDEQYQQNPEPPGFPEWRGDEEAIGALDKGNHEGGYTVALQRVTELMIDRHKRGIYATTWQIATLYTRGGMTDKALSWFEKAYEEHDPNIPYFVLIRFLII